MTRVLVTGAHGAVGTALTERLVAAGRDVVGVDDAAHVLDPDLPVRIRDLRTDDPLPDADVVVHLAAHSQVQPTIDRPELATENVATTRRVLDHAVEQDAHVVVASSREVYGSAVRPSEEAAGPAVTNPYGASKVATEALASAYASSFGVDVTTLRLANVYGPHDLNARVVPIFVSKGLAGDRLSVYGASKVLDFVYLADVLDAFERVLDDPAAVAGETVTVGSGRGTSLTDLAGRVVDRIDEAPGYDVEPNRAGDTERFVADVGRAQALLDFEPTTLDEGLARTIKWYRDHPAAREHVLAQVE
jgi:UDP-glucose 4-epimerase